MRVKNVMRLVATANDIIDIRYDIDAYQVMQIYTASRDKYERIINGFKLGYVQGVKATRAEQKARDGA